MLRRVEQIVREEQDAAGAQEILMPTVQTADLWRQSGLDQAEAESIARRADTELDADLPRRALVEREDLHLAAADG